MKQKGPLFLEQRSDIWNKFPSFSPEGKFFEPLFSFLDLLNKLLQRATLRTPDKSGDKTGGVQL